MKIIIPTLILSLTSLFSISIAQEKTMQNTVVKSPSVATKTPPRETHLISRKDFIETSEKLIRGIKTPEDMTLARVESITGLKFRQGYTDKNLYIYRMHFDDGNKAAFMLDIEHLSEDKQRIIRPRFSLNIHRGGKGSFFDAIKLFKPMIAKELGYKEYFHPWAPQLSGFEYHVGKGKSRLFLTLDSELINIKAEEYVEVRGSRW